MTNRRDLLAGMGILTMSSFAGCLSSEDDGDSTEPDNTESEQSDDNSTRRDISTQYEMGKTSVEGGKAGISNGILDFNLERYDSAVESFDNAIEAFERSEGQFSEAVDLTYEIENSEAREICERGESHAATLRNAAEQYKQAADAANNNRGADTVNSRISQAESLENEAEQSPLRDQSTLDSVLDL